MIKQFSQAGGTSPSGRLLFGIGGSLYGEAAAGAVGGGGTIFCLDPPGVGATAWKEVVLHKFPGFDASGSTYAPSGGLFADSAGNFYGTTYYSASGTGALFEVKHSAATPPAWKTTILTDLTALMQNGATPNGDLISDGTGSLIGTSLYGGTNGGGAVFRVSPPTSQHKSWTSQLLYSFPTRGLFLLGPEAGLTPGDGGVFYGTTVGEGTSQGSIFQITPPAAGQTSWTESDLHYFTDNDGSDIAAGLTLSGSGLLYGVAAQGGIYGTSNCGRSGCGTVFSFDPSSATLNVLYSFSGMPSDGDLPVGRVIVDRQGSLYDTTASGGMFDQGTIFKLSPPTVSQVNWTETVLYSFTGTKGDGEYPAAALVADSAGNLFGTTERGGGSSGGGTVFEISGTGFAP